MFVNPVMTKCNHYFCEKCALERYKKNSKCFVCNTQTYGVFNPAKEIIKKMKEREAAMASDEEPENEQETPEEN